MNTKKSDLYLFHCPLNQDIINGFPWTLKDRRKYLKYTVIRPNPNVIYMREDQCMH